MESKEKEALAGEQNSLDPKILAVPDIRQPNNFTCGAASAMCVGKYFGVGPDTLDEWIKELDTTVEESTHPESIINYLTSLGLHVVAKSNMTLADLHEEWIYGSPIICPLQDYGPEVPPEAKFNYGHYLTVIGVALEHVFCQDSSADNVLEYSGTIADKGRILVDQETWMNSWYDKDIDGNLFTNYGIIVSKPFSSDVTEHISVENMSNSVSNSVNQRTRNKLEKKQLDDVISQLKQRQEPVKVKNKNNEESLILLPSTFVRLKDSGTDNITAIYTDSNSQKIKSDTGAKNPSHTFLISTPSKDRAGDVVEIKGCIPHLESYRKNANVFFNHKSEDFPIGNSSLDNNLLLAFTDLGIEATCIYNLATSDSEMVYKFVDNGWLKGASIGFKPIKAKFLKLEKTSKESDNKDEFSFEFPGFHFIEWELLEWSICGTPCNGDAVRMILDQKNLSDKLKLHFSQQLPDSTSVSVPVSITNVDNTQYNVKFFEDLLIEHLDEVDEKFKSLENSLELKLNNTNTISNNMDISNTTPVVTSTTVPRVTPTPIVMVPIIKDTSAEGYIPPITGLDPDHHERPDLPHGAKVVHHLHKGLDHLHKMLETHVKKIEHNKTKPFVEAKMAECKAHMSETMKFLAKTYPEQFPGYADGKSLETLEAEEIEIKKQQELQNQQELENKKTQESLDNLALLFIHAKDTTDKLKDSLYKLTGKEI